jgi:hypothetical protein
MLRSILFIKPMYSRYSRPMKENTLISSAQSIAAPALREDFSEYVAHLQLHMALHARKLVPNLNSTDGSRQQLLHQTQADFEKFVSRQGL